jgi:hypothetical protein
MKEGRLVYRPVDWIRALEDIRRISSIVTVRTGCRTVDLLHVAAAAQWKPEVFVTADNRQLKAARMMGLATVDARTFRHGGGSSASPSGSVRERRSRYAMQKRPPAKR